MREWAIEACTKGDYDQIVEDIEDFWGTGRSPRLLHPMFIHEFGDTAFVVRDDERVAAYLFGFVASATPTAYVHLVAVRHAYRGSGLARRLYDHFAAIAWARGCLRMKAITSPENLASIAFHARLGFLPVGDAVEAGTPVVPDYSGPGIDRVVMIRDL